MLGPISVTTSGGVIAFAAGLSIPQMALLLAAGACMWVMGRILGSRLTEKRLRLRADLTDIEKYARDGHVSDAYAKQVRRNLVEAYFDRVMTSTRATVDTNVEDSAPQSGTTVVYVVDLARADCGTNTLMDIPCRALASPSPALYPERRRGERRRTS